MDKKDHFLIPTLVLSLCAGVAPPMAHAVGRLAGARLSVRVSAHTRPIQAGASPFVLFDLLPADKAAADKAAADKPVAMGKGSKNNPGNVTSIYTLHFLRGPLPTTDVTPVSDSGIDAYGTDKAATDAASFLNTLYPDTTSVQAHQNHLILTGPADQVNTLRQMLALNLDVPSPQVKADIYTIQVNTTSHNRDAAQDKIEEIQAGIQIVRDLIHGSEIVLGAYLADNDRAKVKENSTEPGDPKNKLFAAMELDGYNSSPNRPLGLTDMLIFLAVSDRKQFANELTPGYSPPPSTNAPRPPFLSDKLEKELFKVRKLVSSGDMPLKSDIYKVDDAKAYSRHGENLKKLIDRIETKVMLARQGQYPVFRRLAGAYSTPAINDMNGMTKFLDAWHSCKSAFLQPLPSQPATTPDQKLEEYPDQLSSTSAATDLLLKEAMDALTGDLQELYFQPLLDWIREDVRGVTAGGSGIDLVGTTSITVRDRTLVQTQGTADSYFKYTPIPHLTMESLTGAKMLANGTPATPDTTTNRVATDVDGPVRMANGDPLLLKPSQQVATDAQGKALRNGTKNDGDPVVLTIPNMSQTKSPSALASTIFGALTPLQALGLQAVFSEDAVLPSFRKIAPGTSLAIRPFVLPDGGSARVQMSLTSTVDSDAPDTTKRDVPFDVIAKQTVNTEATISAFDLETVASFGVQTTALGDWAWRIPILDQIPLLGDVFHGPRRRETKRQDSIAIVNLTILPRSLDLVPYYVASPATSPPPAPPAKQ